MKMKTKIGRAVSLVSGRLHWEPGQMMSVSALQPTAWDGQDGVLGETGLESKLDRMTFHQSLGSGLNLNFPTL